MKATKETIAQAIEDFTGECQYQCVLDILNSQDRIDKEAYQEIIDYYELDTIDEYFIKQIFCPDEIDEELEEKFNNEIENSEDGKSIFDLMESTLDELYNDED